MKAMVLLVSGLLMSFSTLWADVVVYRGTARVAADLSTTSRVPRVISLYILVDFETREFSSIGFWNKKGEKRMIDGSPSSIDIAEASIAGGRTATAMASGTSTSTDVTAFFHNLLYLRGKNAELLIQQEPVPARISRPRSFRGQSLTLQSSASSRTFSELTLALSYDQRATLTANNAGRTIAEATDDLELQLTNKGYTPPL